MRTVSGMQGAERVLETAGEGPWLQRRRSRWRRDVPRWTDGLGHQTEHPCARPSDPGMLRSTVAGRKDTYRTLGEGTQSLEEHRHDEGQKGLCTYVGPLGAGMGHEYSFNPGA